MEVEVKLEIPPIPTQQLPTIHQLKNNIKQRQSIMQTFNARKEPPHEPRITGWATLPIQILEKIFLYVDHHHLITFCTLVCKYWRRAICTNRFMTSLAISRKEAPLSFIYNYLRQYKHLNCLSLNNVPEMESIIIQAHKVCRDLKCISLTNYKYIGYNVLAYLIKNFPNLQGLSLASSNVACRNIANDITMFVNLQKLNLYNVRTQGLNTQGIREIILNCRELEEFNIGLCQPMVNLEDDDVLVILSNLAPKLTSLSLDSRRLTMRSLEKLQDCKKLRCLHIKYAVNMTGDFLTEFLANLYPIDELGFTHNCIINGRDVRTMIQNGAEVFRNLRTLDFTYCVQLSDVGLEAIANNCVKLQKILLKSCRRVTNIVPVFKHCKHLRYVDLSFCAQLKLDFVLPVKMEVLVIDEREEWQDYIKNLKRRYLQIYLCTSEFLEHLERI